MSASNARKAAVADAGGIEPLVNLVGHGDAAGRAAAAVALGNLMSGPDQVTGAHEEPQSSGERCSAAIGEFLQGNRSLQQKLLDTRHMSSAAIGDFLQGSQSLQQRLMATAGMETRVAEGRASVVASRKAPVFELPQSPGESCSAAIEEFLQGSERLQHRLMASAGLQAKGTAAHRGNAPLREVSYSPQSRFSGVFGEFLQENEGLQYNSKEKMGQGTIGRASAVPLQELLNSPGQSCSSPIGKFLQQNYSLPPAKAVSRKVPVYELPQSPGESCSAAIEEFLQGSERLRASSWQSPKYGKSVPFLGEHTKKNVILHELLQSPMSPIGKLLQTGQHSWAQKCSKLPIFELPTSPAESSSAAIEQFLQGKVAVEGSRKNSASHRPDKLPMMPQSPTESCNVAIEQFLLGNQSSPQNEMRIVPHQSRPQHELLLQSPTASCAGAIEQFLGGDKMAKSLEQRLHERLYETKNTSSWDCHSASTADVTSTIPGRAEHSPPLTSQSSATEEDGEACSDTASMHLSYSYETAQLSPEHAAEEAQAARSPEFDSKRSTSTEASAEGQSMEPGSCLRELGAELFAEVDIDETGKLDIDELAMLLLKFARSYKGNQSVCHIVQLLSM